MTALPEPENTPRSMDAAAPDNTNDDTAACPPLYAVPDETAAETTGEIPTVVDASAAAADVAEPEPGKNRERAEKALVFLKTAFTPQSGLYTDRQPTIAETVRRAEAGDHLGLAGPLRKAAIGYGYFTAAVDAVCLTVMWLARHPARLLLTLLVTGLLVGLLLALAL